ncbi:hypothetical protein ACIQB5_51650 [Streptomyces sp. NPDC088560]|uniref:hypothetical protein n=1 Tax=Streptomyces sp. NPDC088560 TaxID=3365868 RepID=UPI003818E904
MISDCKAEQDIPHTLTRRALGVSGRISLRAHYLLGQAQRARRRYLTTENRPDKGQEGECRHNQGSLNPAHPQHHATAHFERVKDIMGKSSI